MMIGNLEMYDDRKHTIINETYNRTMIENMQLYNDRKHTIV